MIELLLAAERLLSVGMLDQAERLFEQVAEADPRNSIAVVGLARVALERGDEPAAIELAKRALEIDGENVAARRMVERLEEVAATRDGAASPAAEPAAEPAAAATPVAMEPVAPAPESVVEPVTAPVVPAEAAPRPAPRRSWLRRLLDRLMGR